MLDVTGLHTYHLSCSVNGIFRPKFSATTQSFFGFRYRRPHQLSNRRWYDAGFEQRELLGRPLLELATPACVLPLSDALRTIARSKLELQILRGNGELRQFSVNLSPMRRRGSRTSAASS